LLGCARKIGLIVLGIATVRNCQRCARADGRTGLIRDDERQRAGVRGRHAARAAKSGGRARIPNGRIVPGMEINTGWSWHLEDVTFAESTIELCDGRPSDVERQGTGFVGGDSARNDYSDCGKPMLSTASEARESS